MTDTTRNPFPGDDDASDSVRSWTDWSVETELGWAENPLGQNGFPFGLMFIVAMLTIASLAGSSSILAGPPSWPVWSLTLAAYILGNSRGARVEREQARRLRAVHRTIDRLAAERSIGPADG